MSLNLTDNSLNSRNAMLMESLPSIKLDIHDDKNHLSSKSDASVSSKQTTSAKTNNDVDCMLDLEKSKSGSKFSERIKQKSWYNVIYPSYKSRSDQFKKLFKEVPDDQQLIIDYSCAIQRDILVHGRMFVSKDYMCFHSNIFGWETHLVVKWKHVIAMTKEKMALVIPNAILISTDTEKFFITSFAARDKTYLMLFRVWQDALMGKSMLPQEIWQIVHMAYGDRLGLTTDDEDCVDPKNWNSQHDSSYLDEISKTVKVNTIDTELDQIESNSKNVPISTKQKNEKIAPLESTAKCTSSHDGRQLVNAILPIDVDNLLEMLFSESKFFSDFHNKRKTTNMIYRDWIDNKDGTKTRTLNFTVAITQAIGPKLSNMTEVQVMRDCSVPGQLYSIDIKSMNAGIPYADSFHTATHFCLMRTDEEHTMFSVYVEIKYTKSVWGVVKGFIEKNAWAGLENFYNDLLKTLQNEKYIPQRKSQIQSTKSAVSRDNSIEEAPQMQSSFKRTMKTNKEPSFVLQTSDIASKQNPLSTQCSYDSDSHNDQNYLIFDMFSVFVMILIIALVLLNIYLLGQLYVLNQKQSESTQFDRTFNNLFDQLNGDSNEIKRNWLKISNNQKSIHEAELVKWRQFIESTVDLLQTVIDGYSKFNLELKLDDIARDEF